MPSSTWAVSTPPLASHLASTGRYWGQAQGLEDLGELKKHLWGIRGDDIEAWTRDGLHSLAPASWHPSFRCYSSWLSLQGCLLSLLTFVFTWWTALIAVILLLLLTPFCKKPGEEGQVGKGVRVRNSKRLTPIKNPELPTVNLHFLFFLTSEASPLITLRRLFHCTDVNWAPRSIWALTTRHHSPQEACPKCRIASRNSGEGVSRPEVDNWWPLNWILPANKFCSDCRAFTIKKKINCQHLTCI